MLASNKKNLLTVLVILVFLGILGVVLWYFVTHPFLEFVERRTGAPVNKNEWKTYKNAHFAFLYPETWIVQSQSTNRVVIVDPQYRTSLSLRPNIEKAFPYDKGPYYPGVNKISYLNIYTITNASSTKSLLPCSSNQNFLIILNPKYPQQDLYTEPAMIASDFEYVIDGETCGTIDEQTKYNVANIFKSFRFISTSDPVITNCQKTDPLYGFRFSQATKVYAKRNDQLEWIATGGEFKMRGYNWDCVEWFDLTEQVPSYIIDEFPLIPAIETPTVWKKYTPADGNLSFYYAEGPTGLRSKLPGHPWPWKLIEFSGHWQLGSLDYNSGQTWRRVDQEIYALKRIIVDGKSVMVIVSTPSDYAYGSFWSPVFHESKRYQLEQEFAGGYPEPNPEARQRVWQEEMEKAQKEFSAVLSSVKFSQTELIVLVSHFLKLYDSCFMKCIILAGGMGARLRPLTNHTPKPLLTVGGRTILEHTLEALPDEITSVVIAVKHLGLTIKAVFGKKWHNKKIIYVDLISLRGTMDALKQCKKYVKGKTLVLYGDDLYKKTDLNALLNASKNRDDTWFIMVYPNGDATRFGQVLTDERRRVYDIIEPYVDTPRTDTSAIVNTGAYILDERIFKYKPVKIPSGEYGLPQTMVQAKKEIPLIAVQATNWTPLNTIEDYKKANGSLF